MKYIFNIIFIINISLASEIICDSGFSYNYCADKNAVSNMKKSIENKLSNQILDKYREHLLNKNKYLQPKFDKELTIKYKLMLKDFITTIKKINKTSYIDKHIPPLFMINLKNNNNLSLTEYGKDIFPIKSHEIIIKSLSNAIIPVASSALKLNLYQKILFSDIEINKKKFLSH